MAGQTSATRTQQSTARAIKVRSGAKASARVKVPKPAAVKVEANGSEAPPKPTRRKVKVETRTRVYWGVFNPDLKRVATFEFDQKEQAEKRADKLTQSSGGPHFIQKIKATVQV